MILKKAGVARINTASMLVGEQVLYAATNVIVTAAFARVLSVEYFAIYASAYAIVILFSLLHHGALCDALFVFPRLLNSYKEKIIWLYAAIIFSILCLIVVFFAMALNSASQVLIIGFSILSVASLNQYFRRYNQAAKNYKPPFIAALVFCVTAFFTLWYLLEKPIDPIFKMVLPQTIGYLAANFVNYGAYRLNAAKITTVEYRLDKSLFEAIKFSLVLFFNNLISWIPSNVYQWILFLQEELLSAGSFRVIQTILVPYFLVLAAVSGPLSQTFQKKTFSAVFIFALIGLLMAPIVGALVLILIGAPLITWAFGSNYENLGNLSAFASICIMPSFACALFTAWLRANKKTSIVLIGTLVNVLVLLLVGVPYAAGNGLYMIFATIGLGSLISLLTMFCTYHVSKMQIASAVKDL